VTAIRGAIVHICSYVLRSRPASVKQRFDEAGPDGLAVSAVVLAELLFGAARHPAGAVIRREIGDFVSRLTVLPWTRPRRSTTAISAPRSRSAAGRSAP
jgi:predicted nucleic acid-binding protein